VEHAYEENCPRGMLLVSITSDGRVRATTDNGEDVALHSPESHSYIFRRDFPEKIAIEVVNDSSFEFPEIKSITPNPPK